jgi:hypothetical protein
MSFDSVDVDKDNVVTRKEMEVYINTQLVERIKK